MVEHLVHAVVRGKPSTSRQGEARWLMNAAAMLLRKDKARAHGAIRFDDEGRREDVLEDLVMEADEVSDSPANPGLELQTDKLAAPDVSRQAARPIQYDTDGRNHVESLEPSSGEIKELSGSKRPGGHAIILMWRESKGRDYCPLPQVG